MRYSDMLAGAFIIPPKQAHPNRLFRILLLVHSFADAIRVYHRPLCKLLQHSNLYRKLLGTYKDRTGSK